ncbi:uncharacterized protein LOC124938843 isoform X2 [Impatiens glandulifera]|uniref:uncharacterized protein LOC124938843 isoform X2 n=1 Tax=Impatiens glandulifera TaxID=253017 RepID=UPI001FB0B9B9|nr:uncharacterized protein LOC124938843 isoform X2 [Impatiens glandulifera]
MSSKALPISQEQDTKIKPDVSLAHTMLKNFFRIQVWLEELLRLSDKRQSKPAERNEQVSSSSSSSLPRDQTLQKPRTQKPADERCFTWAVVGLTVAIVLLLSKKFIKLKTEVG